MPAGISVTQSHKSSQLSYRNTCAHWQNTIAAISVPLFSCSNDRSKRILAMASQGGGLVRHARTMMFTELAAWSITLLLPRFPRTLLLYLLLLSSSSSLLLLLLPTTHTCNTMAVPRSNRDAQRIAMCLVLISAAVYAVAVADTNQAVQWSDAEGHLNVFVVPHSHNDPGWWYPIDEYYSRWTKFIISSVVQSLQEVRKTCSIDILLDRYRSSESARSLSRLPAKSYITAGWVVFMIPCGHSIDCRILVEDSCGARRRSCTNGGWIIPVRMISFAGRPRTPRLTMSHSLHDS